MCPAIFIQSLRKMPFMKIGKIDEEWMVDIKR